MQNQTKKTQLLNNLLWGSSALLLIGLILSRAIFPELTWLGGVLALALIGTLGGLVFQNQKALKSRTAAYGLNSVVTILLVLGIVGVLNFLASRYPGKLDLTQNKVHTLSDQTVKLVKGLQKPVKATYFANFQKKEQSRTLLENYKSLSPKFELEMVDPVREPTRTKQAGVKSNGTLVLAIGSRESKVEEVTEEKLTNSLIKLLKEKSPLLCAITGHGEKSMMGTDAEGYASVKKALSDQSYEVKEISLLQEGKILEPCDAIAILGPNKSFFEPETKAIRNYLDQGGRAVIAVDLNLKGKEYSPELVSILESWYVKPLVAFVVDPLSRLFGVDFSQSIINTFSRESSITKDYKVTSVFPFSRPIEILAGAPASLSVQWLAQTTPNSWAVTDFGQIAKGEIRYQEGKDKKGPLNAAVTVEGKQKDSKATKNTRIVVFGTSFFANNQFSRAGGNLDFFVNSVSWVLEDESMISIRAKEEGSGKIEVSQKGATFIGILTIFLIPMSVAAAGIVMWIIRRKL